jgi:hypothetical protein
MPCMKLVSASAVVRGGVPAVAGERILPLCPGAPGCTITGASAGLACWPGAVAAPRRSKAVEIGQTQSAMSKYTTWRFAGSIGSGGQRVGSWAAARAPQERRSLRRRSYSSCGPIQNQKKSFSLRLASARYPCLRARPRRGRLASVEAKGGWDWRQTVHIACRPVPGSLAEEHRNHPRIPPTRGNGRSLGALLAAPSKPFLERSVVAGLDFPIDLLKKVRAAAARREILFHLAIPTLLFQFFQPIGELLTIGFGEMDYGLFDHFHGHIPTIASLKALCKPGSSTVFRVAGSVQKA